MESGKKLVEEEVSRDGGVVAEAGYGTALNVVLVGHPRVGKAALLKALVQSEPREKTYGEGVMGCGSGRLETLSGIQLELVDLPGVISLASRSAEAAVNRGVLLGHFGEETRPHLVMAAMTSELLDRQLPFVLQLVELGVPLWVLVKQEGESYVDQVRLAEELGVPVLAYDEASESGLDELRAALDPPFPERKSEPRVSDARVETAVGKLARRGEEFGLDAAQAYWLLADTGYRTSDGEGVPLAAQIAAREIAADLVSAGENPELRLDRLRRGRAHRLARRALYKKGGVDSWRAVVDRELVHSFRGPVYWLAILFVAFLGLFFFAGAAQEGLWRSAVSVTEGGGASWWVKVGVGVMGVLSYFPFLLWWFLLWSLMESSGLSARFARLLNRKFQACGLEANRVVQMFGSAPSLQFWKGDSTTFANSREGRLYSLAKPFLFPVLRLPVLLLLISALVSQVYLRALCLLWVFGMLVGVAWILFGLLNSRASSSELVRREARSVLPPLRWPEVRFVAIRTGEGLVRFLILGGALAFLGACVLNGGEASGEKVPLLAWGVEFFQDTLSAVVAHEWLNVGVAVDFVVNSQGGPLADSLTDASPRAHLLGALVFFVFSVPLVSGIWSLRHACGSWGGAIVQWIGFFALAVVMVLVSQSLFVMFV